MNYPDFLFDVDFYAGIGSRKINKKISEIMMRFACCMAFAGLKVNSGGADGSDTSFETGARIAYDAMCKLDPNLPVGEYGRVMSVFLPWDGFNNRKNNRKAGYVIKIPEKAMSITSGFHPGWKNLGDGPRKLMSRNAMQVLCESLDRPVKFVSAYTSDGATLASETSSKTGGTGQAIRISESFGVNVYNMGKKEHLTKVLEWIDAYSEKIKHKYGLDPRELVSDYLSSYKGIAKHKEGNLIELAKEGEADVIIHGCNCFNTMDSGIAAQFKNNFPEVFEADLKTKKGDIKKLGTYSKSVIMSNGKQIEIINAYTQHKYGSNDELYADYEAIRKVMKQIKKDFSNKKIFFPRIGVGSANGCWTTISNIISGELFGLDYCLIDSPFSMEPEKINKQEIEAEQLGMGF